MSHVVEELWQVQGGKLFENTYFLVKMLVKYVQNENKRKRKCYYRIVLNYGTKGVNLVLNDVFYVLNDKKSTFVLQ